MELKLTNNKPTTRKDKISLLVLSVIAIGLYFANFTKPMDRLTLSVYSFMSASFWMCAFYYEKAKAKPVWQYMHLLLAVNFTLAIINDFVPIGNWPYLATAGAAFILFVLSFKYTFKPL